MSYKKQFFEDFAKFHGIKFTITSIEQECSYYEGCPTCGGDYEYTVWVAGIDEDGKRTGTSVDGTISDFINSLT